MATWQPSQEQALELAEKLVRYFTRDEHSGTSLGFVRSNEFLSLLQSATAGAEEFEAFARKLETEAETEGSAFYELTVWARRIAEIRRQA